MMFPDNTMPTALLWILLGLLGTVASVTFMVYICVPKYIVHMLNRISLLRCGLKLRKLQLGEETIEYIERAQPSPSRPSIIFLHGFARWKETWSQAIKHLPGDVHVVAFDLPGHGGTTYDLPDHEMSVNTFVEHLHQYVTVLGLNRRPFHLVGQSMGGTICGKYSATYPWDVALVTLVCPGMRTPELSEAAIQASLGNEPLTEDTPEGVQHTMDLCLHNKVIMDTQLLVGLIEMQKPRKTHHDKLLKALRSDRVRQGFLDCLPRISASTQVIWGDEDKLVDISGLLTLRECLARLSRVDIIPDCGHSVNVDQPQKLARLLLIHNNSAYVTY